MLLTERYKDKIAGVLAVTDVPKPGDTRPALHNGAMKVGYVFALPVILFSRGGLMQIWIR
ncbi:MAG: hypothetical protein J7639_30425 [Paenibacillaceae bacterium]|nr:hypothetical protein [Paenibacillaceae bacterium]